MKIQSYSDGKRVNSLMGVVTRKVIHLIGLFLAKFVVDGCFVRSFAEFISWNLSKKSELFSFF